MFCKQNHTNKDANPPTPYLVRGNSALNPGANHPFSPCLSMALILWTTKSSLDYTVFYTSPKTIVFSGVPSDTHVHYNQNWISSESVVHTVLSQTKCLPVLLHLAEQCSVNVTLKGAGCMRCEQLIRHLTHSCWVGGPSYTGGLGNNFFLPTQQPW